MPSSVGLRGLPGSEGTRRPGSEGTRVAPGDGPTQPPSWVREGGGYRGDAQDGFRGDAQDGYRWDAQDWFREDAQDESLHLILAAATPTVTPGDAPHSGSRRDPLSPPDSEPLLSDSFPDSRQPFPDSRTLPDSRQPFPDSWTLPDSRTPKRARATDEGRADSGVESEDLPILSLPRLPPSKAPQRRPNIPGLPGMGSPGEYGMEGDRGSQGAGRGSFGRGGEGSPGAPASLKQKKQGSPGEREGASGRAARGASGKKQQAERGAWGCQQVQSCDIDLCTDDEEDVTEGTHGAGLAGFGGDTWGAHGGLPGSRTLPGFRTLPGSHQHFPDSRTLPDSRQPFPDARSLPVYEELDNDEIAFENGEGSGWEEEERMPATDDRDQLEGHGLFATLID
ncbi:hypothetical protein T492DRAFT_832916 [Pavlovales sp. CCMP2436]|nr:hypothetical protein T492DRAFT_832916 [Pavlovales sp. CCMP2436]